MRKRNAGFTMVELMIAVGLNMLLFSALLAVYLANLDHYRRTLNIMRLNQQLQAVMTVISSDLRRAGYWANARTDVGLAQNNNPFMASGTDVSITGSCILFSYDRDSNGSLPAVSSSIDDERYGFRLINQAVQARPPGAAFSCAAAANAWENLTDPNVIQITTLSFVLNSSTVTTGPGTQGILMRSVDITLTGRLTSDNTVSKTLTQRVRIRNDKFIP